MAKRVILSGNYTPGKFQGKSDGPRFASSPCCAQSLRTGRARRGVRRFSQCGLRSARLRQGRTRPSQRRAARSAGTAVDAGARQGRVRLSVRDSAGPRRSRQVSRAGARHRRSTAGGCESAAAEPFAQQHRHGHGAQRAVKGTAGEAAGKSRCGHGARRGDAGQCAETATGTAQHHPENLSRRGAGAAAAGRHRRLRIHRAAGGVLVQSFLHLRQQGRAGADVGRLVRARGDPAARARAFRRHAEGGRAASGDAVLSRQPAIAGPGFARREKPQPRTERKSRPRNPRTAYARRRRRLFAGRT